MKKKKKNTKLYPPRREKEASSWGGKEKLHFNIPVSKSIRELKRGGLQSLKSAQGKGGRKNRAILSPNQGGRKRKTLYRERVTFTTRAH